MKSQIRHTLLWLISWLIALSWACHSIPREIGVVTHVSDGDSFRFQPSGGGKTISVRLFGIDAPESGQNHGDQARLFTEALLEGKTVQLDIIDQDQYGRWVVDAYLSDGRLANRAIVAAGHAWWYRKYAPYDFKLEELEAIARDKNLGLWRQNNPKPPWQYRQNKRKSSSN